MLMFGSTPKVDSNLSRNQQLILIIYFIKITTFQLHVSLNLSESTKEKKKILVWSKPKGA